MAAIQEDYNTLPPFLNSLRRVFFLKYERSPYVASRPGNLRADTRHLLNCLRPFFRMYLTRMVPGFGMMLGGLFFLVISAKYSNIANAMLPLGIVVFLLGVAYVLKILRDATHLVIVHHFKFLRGDMGPAIILSQKPLRLAVIFETSLGKTASRKALKAFDVIEEYLPNAKAGQRLATASYFKPNEDHSEWVDLFTTPLQVATANPLELELCLIRIPSHEWDDLEKAISSLPKNFNEGVFPLTDGVIADPNQLSL